jgi:hypothetical protein
VWVSSILFVLSLVVVLVHHGGRDSFLPFLRWRFVFFFPRSFVAGTVVEVCVAPDSFLNFLNVPSMVIVVTQTCH